MLTCRSFHRILSGIPHDVHCLYLPFLTTQPVETTCIFQFRLSNWNILKRGQNSNVSWPKSHNYTYFFNYLYNNFKWFPLPLHILLLCVFSLSLCKVVNCPWRQYFRHTWQRTKWQQNCIRNSISNVWIKNILILTSNLLILASGSFCGSFSSLRLANSFCASTSTSRPIISMKFLANLSAWNHGELKLWLRHHGNLLYQPNPGLAGKHNHDWQK